MKSKPVPLNQALVSYLFIFLSTVGLSCGLVKHFVLNKPDFAFLVLMTCLFVVSLASWQRKKYAK
jgi:hypothetical protein